MSVKTKPAAPRRTRASGIVLAAERDTQNTISTRTINQQVGDVVVYDGMTCSGWLQARNGGWLAFANSGKFLGQYASQKLAATAVYQGRRS